MIFDRYDPNAARLQPTINEVMPTSMERMGLAFQSTSRGDSHMARSRGLSDVFDTIITSINEDVGPIEFRDIGGEQVPSRITINPAMFLNEVSLLGTFGEREYRYAGQQFFDNVLAYEEANPGSISPEILNLMSFDAVEQRMAENAIALRQEFESVAALPGGSFVEFVGQFAGGMQDIADDPLQAASMFVGGAGAKTLYAFAFREALIGAGFEAARQPQLAEWYGRLGIEYSSEDFFRNVGFGAAAGAGFAVGAEAIGMGLRRAFGGGQRPPGGAVGGQPTSNPDPLNLLSTQQLREGVEAMRAAGVSFNSEASAAFTLAQRIEETQSFNFGLPPAEYARNLSLAELGVAEGKIPEDLLYNTPSVATREALQAAQPEMENLGGVLYAFDPRDIGVDARTFQFKGGGDEFGVTDRLQFITEWDPQLAGVVTVYEYADGRLFVADGHQRVGLARRLMAQNPDLNIQLYGYRLREIDGITPEQAMISAAITNIAQGTGSIIDAAKIARMDPERFRSMVGRTLPPTSQLVRQARDMMALSQDAFGSVINEVIPSNYGAVVGRILGDRPELQQAAISVLARAEPANVFQAEAIVRQVREADVDVATQQSLFGEEMVVESLYTERARVLDRAVKTLREDRAAFANLVRNAENIESAGNVLDRSVNQRRADLDGQAIALVQTLANRKGPLSDALSDAARLARDTGSYGASTRQFVESIRRAITDGDFERLTSGEVGRVVNDTPPSGRSEVGKEPSLAGFDEPTGHGRAVEQQADDLTREMFPEEVGPAPEPAPVVRTPKQIEADLKARQPVETVDDIYELAPAAQDYIAGIGRQIQDELGVEFKNPGLKKIETTREKMTRKSYASSNQITDVSRAGFIVRNAADADAIAARFGREAEILDENWNVTPEGFFDRKILVRTPNGIISEIQIWSPELYKAKFSADNQFGKSGQDLYTAWRNEADPETKARLANNQRELYAAAINREDQSFRALLGIEMAPKVPSNADLNAASLAMTRPVDQTSAASTGVQGPPGARMATASLGEMEIAGRPSQSTSIIDQTPMDEVTRAQQELFAGVNMDEEIPISAIVDPETGEISAQTMTMRDLKQMLDEEDSFIERLGYCTR
jgi:hypothetical protein